MLRDVLIQKGLSNREAEVAEHVSKGLSNKEVANRLFVTEKTVKFHLTNIYKKMNVKSRAQLIVWCLPHMGFVEAQTNQQNINNSGGNMNVAQPTQNTGIDSIPVGNSTVSSGITTTNDINQNTNNTPNNGNNNDNNNGGQSGSGGTGMGVFGL